MSVKDEKEMGNVVRQAVLQSNNVILIVPNAPSLEYFTSRAVWLSSLNLFESMGAFRLA